MAKRLGSQLFVSRLSFYTTNRDLRRLFSPFGEIREENVAYGAARLVIDQRTQRPKGFGFVTFESETDAQNALKSMDGKIINGNMIFVEVATNSSHGGDGCS